MMRARPAFLITIDTEGDNLWAAPREVTTENAAWLPRFQALCERFAFRPTYLTNYEMVMDSRFVDFARSAMDRGGAEVGMHLHAWNSPPEHRVTDDDYRRVPYLVDYPTPVLRAKVRDMTARLEDVFGRKVVSHRAGRWTMDARYVETLIEEGYLVDCSVTPYVSWRSNYGAVHGVGGSDYRHCGDRSYFVDPTDLLKPGTSPLLEVPVTVMPRHRLTSRSVPAVAYAHPLCARVLNKLLPNDWLRPRRGNRERMVAIVERAARDGHDHLELMTHSSELMPVGSP